MKTIIAVAVLALSATAANAQQQIYINQSTGQLVLVQPTPTVQVGGTGSVGSNFPSSPGVVTIGGAGSIGNGYQVYNPGVAVIGGGQ